MKKNILFLTLILFSLFISSCKYDFILPDYVPPVKSGVSFTTQILPILTEKCVSCHATQAPQMTAAVAYAQLVPQYVSTATPESSVFYINASSGNHFARVTSVQAATILTWITEGAKNN
jgi:hypothetical protein